MLFNVEFAKLGWLIDTLLIRLDRLGLGIYTQHYKPKVITEDPKAGSIHKRKGKESLPFIISHDWSCLA